jgi:hypothetical protein
MQVLWREKCKYFHVNRYKIIQVSEKLRHLSLLSIWIRMCTMLVAYNVGVCMQIIILLVHSTFEFHRMSPHTGLYMVSRLRRWLLEQAVGVVNLMKENLNEICVAVSVCKCWPAEFSIPKGAQAL